MPQESAPNLTPDTAGTTSRPDDGFASDLGGEDTSAAVQVEPASTPSNGSNPFDPATVDWYRDDVPDTWKPYQKQLKNQLAEQTRANQQRADLERQNNELWQHLQGRGTEDKLAAAVEKLAPREDPYADLRSRLEPQEAGAIDVVREIIKRELGNTTPQMDPQAVQQIQQLQQHVQALTQYVQSFQVQQTSADLQAAVDKHGAGALQGIIPNIRALVQTPNPKTRKAFTVTEAADLLLGAAQDARDTDRQVRTTAKRQAAGSSGVPAGKSGPMTDAELLSELRGLGFK